MRNLVAFLLRYQGAMLFVLLEVVSLYLFITNSSYQRAAFFNSANAYTGAVLAKRQEVTDYFHLAALNQQLLAENASLRKQLFPPDFAHREADSLPVGRDTLGHLVYRHLKPLAAAPPPAARNQQLRTRPDSLLLGGVRLAAHDAQYPLVPARVVDNSLRSVDNYLTLNVGEADGVQPGLGVVSATGVVGRVRSVSAHYATVASLLHSKTAVAAKIKRDGTFGSVKWPGDDFSHALLDYIPRQNRVAKGDTIVTSAYNAVFPEGVLIGTVESFVKESDKNFWTITLRLGTDFSRLTYVYVVPNRHHAERDSLQASLSAPEPATRQPAVAAPPVAPVVPLVLPPGYHPDPSKTATVNAAIAQAVAKTYAAKLKTDAAKAAAAKAAAKASGQPAVLPPDKPASGKSNAPHAPAPTSSPQLVP
ncbi:MAG: rod shape-determining protein MreC [Janthinobacterium lividum]